MKLWKTIPAMLILAGCATHRIWSGDGYALYMDGVTAEMTSAEYWLKPSTHPDRIIMTQSEISDWSIVPEAQFDTISEAGKTDAEYLARWKNMIIHDNLLYDNAGNVLEPHHWNSAIENFDIERYSGKVRYAVTVRNTEERILPTAERGFQNIDNSLFDDHIMTMLLAAEPLLVLHQSLDGMWYFVIGQYAPAGWVYKDDIAFCSDRKSWEETQSGDFLLVTANRIRLDMKDPGGRDYTELSMGTKLKLMPADSVHTDTDQRFGKNVYAVSFPYRKEDGMLGLREVFLPAREGVHVGYLPYTRRNILNLAFSCLGDRYGWGGTFGARDCSSYIQDIYRCFGILLPRNSSRQIEFHGRTLDLSGMSTEQKYKVLKKEAVPGSVMYMPGHVYMYLGQENGRIYTINSASSVMLNGKKTYIQSVTINTLDEKRANGETWLQSTKKMTTYETDN